MSGTAAEMEEVEQRREQLPRPLRTVTLGIPAFRDTCPSLDIVPALRGICTSLYSRIMTHSPVRHPFGASIVSTMLFKIVPDDFVSHYLRYRRFESKLPNHK